VPVARPRATPHADTTSIPAVQDKHHIVCDLAVVKRVYMLTVVSVKVS